MSNREISVSLPPMITATLITDDKVGQMVTIKLGEVEIDRFKPEYHIYEPARSDVEQQFAQWFQRRVLNPE
jgi:hypothetical protein